MSKWHQLTIIVTSKINSSWVGSLTSRYQPTYFQSVGHRLRWPWYAQLGVRGFWPTSPNTETIHGVCPNPQYYSGHHNFTFRKMVPSPAWAWFHLLHMLLLWSGNLLWKSLGCKLLVTAGHLSQSRYIYIYIHHKTTNLMSYVFFFYRHMYVCNAM